MKYNSNPHYDILEPPMTIGPLGPLGPLFQLGQIVATPGASNEVSAQRMTACLDLHRRGDWGLMTDEDKALNDAAVQTGDRVISAYAIDPLKPSAGHGGNTFWIITESDRSVTTFLLPEEY